MTGSTVELGGPEERGIGVSASDPFSERAGGEGFRRRDAAGEVRFEIPLPADIAEAPGGNGGRPPLARPLRIVRVSVSR